MSQFGFPLVSRPLVSRLLPVAVVLLGLVLSSTWAQEGPSLPGPMTQGGPPQVVPGDQTHEQCHTNGSESNVRFDGLFRL